MTSRALVLALLVATAACGGDAPGAARPANLLLLSVDTLRQDRCSAYGHDRPTTPRLARLAAEGLRFDDAFAPTSTTGPSHASLFTGLFPVAHRVVRNGLVLDERHRTLAESLRDAGWRTAGIASSFVLEERFGYAQGFDVWQDEFSVSGSSMRLAEWHGEETDGGFDRRATATAKRAVRWLETHGDDGPWFLFAHWFDPHNPYDPPPAHAVRFPPRGAGVVPEAVARYEAEIAYTDEQIGVVLDALDRLGLAEDTLVLLVADHGEELMDHGHMEHGVHIYDETVRVPMIARWPGRLPAGVVVSGPVELADVPPTVRGLLGVAEVGDGDGTGDAPDVQGRDLSAAWRAGAALDPDHAVLLHRRHYEPRTEGTIAVAGEGFGLRVGGWKLVVAEEEGRRELYDLAADPGETVDLSAREPERAARLARRLADLLAERARGGDAEDTVDEDGLRRLEALGYTK